MQVHQEFSRALDALVEQIKSDRSIVAAILCGSLSHDTVWAKSDIDLVLVTVDDKKLGSSDMALYADGVNVHAILMPRTEFRKTVESSIHNSFMHSFLAKGRLLYSHDPTIADLCGGLAKIGARDAELQLFSAAIHVLPPMYKARKWFVTRGDLEYTALWILYTATPLAKVEVIGAGMLADREVIPQAIKVNPDFFKPIYADLLNTKKTQKTVETALEAIEGYMARHARALFRPVIDHLRETGEARSCIEIEDHFRRNLGVEGVTLACEYLADQKIIGKVSISTHLTKKSNIEIQQLAFVHMEKGRNAF
jgi:predicted nucleotidyltransferase